jgi:signal transduction histidine kinase
MEAGMMEYVRRPNDITVLLEQSLQNIYLPAQKKNLRLEVTCAPSLPLLTVDESRILQVFNNLLSNAVKFTLPGGKVIIATVLRHDRGDQPAWVEVRITDTGMGIPAEEVERIFDRFYQSAYHQKHNQQGTGLGLAIARHIVEAHGGKVWVESQIGEGSTFICRLPINGNVAEQRACLAQQSGVYHAA